MRPVRVGFLPTLVAASLAVPAAATAATTVALAPTGQLGPEGASAVIHFTVTCDPGTTVGSVFANIAQSTGNRLVTGSGGAGSTFGGTPPVCDGTAQDVPITVMPNAVSGTPLRPFKTGKAAVNAFISVSDPSGFSQITVPPTTVTLKK